MTAAVPDPTAISAAAAPWQAPAPAGGFGDWLWQMAQRPGVVETLLALLLLALAIGIWLRLARVVATARRRQAVQDYLLGVEQALAGDLAGAEKRLARVLAEDPENHFARLLYARVLAQRG